ncbi:MAG: nucleoside triphosphate pyrophosphohydrolase [Planctomycetota bacterium]
MVDSTDGARRPAELAAPDDPRILALRRLIGIVDRLRAPDGCPWDLEQTEASMAPCVIEEAHELAEAIGDGDAAEEAAEAGDVLLTVLLVCRIAEQGGRYDLARSANLTCEKLVRRHPHVFGDVEVDGADAVLGNWEAIKKAERAAQQKDTSALAGVPRGMPALLRAMRVSAKAVTAGFRWRNVDGALDKLREEVQELVEALPQEALQSQGRPTLDEDHWTKIDHELGDVLMAGAFLCSYLGRDPEAVCRAAVQRFEGRFRHMEQELKGDLQRDLDELVSAWVRAKEVRA